MIYLLVGENTVKRSQQIADIVADTTARHIDGSEMTVHDVETIFYGQTLFDDASATIVKSASTTSGVWSELRSYIEQGTDATLLFVEDAVDKRTATYKAFQKHARIIDCPWPELRDVRRIEQWLSEYAKANDVELSKEVVRLMVERAIHVHQKTSKPYIDQQQLATAVSQLVGAGSVTAETITAIMEPGSYENVFELLDAALSGDMIRLDGMLEKLQRTEDAHRLLGLLSSQVYNIAGVTLAPSGTPAIEIATSIGANPFALRSVQKYRNNLDAQDMSKAIQLLATADIQIKSAAEPWSALATALQKIAQFRQSRSK